MSLAFWVTTFVVAATPGTGVVFTVAEGLACGRRAAVVAAFGCTLGTVPHIIAALTGLAAVLNASAVAFQTVKWLGVAYLLYLAARTWRDRTPLQLDGDFVARPSRQVIRTAILINLLNPKLTVFFFAFLPQFVHPTDPGATVAMLGLSGIFMAVTFVVFVVYGWFAAAVREHVLVRPRVVAWMRRTFAGTYVLLAGRLAAQER